MKNKKDHILKTRLLLGPTAIAVACALCVLATAPSAHATASIFAVSPLLGDNSISVAGVSADGSVFAGTSYNIDEGGYDGPPNTAEAFWWLNAGPSLVELGFLPGDIDSEATMVSSDGSAVVGVSMPSYDSPVGHAFRWTASSGLVGLGNLPGSTNEYPAAVSSNGVVIIGTCYSASGAQAFRWTGGSGMVGLGYLPGGTNSFASCLSADGSVIVGTSSSASGAQAFRWTAGSGMVGLGRPPGATNWYLSGISADGSIIVGTSYSASGEQAFRWTSDSGMVGLGYLPGYTNNSYAAAVSADGSVIVGTSASPADSRAFRWTTGLGMVLLDTNSFSSASGINDDGSVIVGSDSEGVFRWANGAGLQNLYDLLVANGAGLDNSVLEELDSANISAGGNTIFGEGDDGQGDYYPFIATIPGLIGVSPPLSINSSLSATNQVVLSWSTNYTGCTLQSSSNPGTTNWTNCGSSTVSGVSFVVTNLISAGAQFFRLQR